MMSWTKQDNTILTPGVDLDLRNATINPIKVYLPSATFPIYFSQYLPLPIDGNNAIGLLLGSIGYAITYDSNGNLLDFYYGINDE